MSPLVTWLLNAYVPSKNSPNSLLPLGLAHFGLLVPLGHDVLKSGTDDGSLELLGSLGPLLGILLFNTLLVLPPVQHGPCHLTGVAPQKVSTVASAIEEFEDLKSGAMAKLGFDYRPQMNFHVFREDRTSQKDQEHFLTFPSCLIKVLPLAG